VTSTVAGHAVVQASIEELRALRQTLTLPGHEPLPAAFLKHADDQTVAGMAAVFQAIATHHLKHDFSRWGVIAAPRFLARATLAQALKRFAQEGAWGVSPHLIPHRSLHSVSGTVSQALQIHGPNFGVGGGPFGAAKAMLAAAAMVGNSALSGVWVVLSGWNWDPVLLDARQPSRNGHHDSYPVCRAAALALTGEQLTASGRILHVHPGAVRTAQSSTDSNGSAPGHGEAPIFTLEAICEALADSQVGAQSWQLDCGGWVELERVGSDED
jgi:hypothetical protein